MTSRTAYVYRMLQIFTQLPFSESLHAAAHSSTIECLSNTCPYFLGYKKKEKKNFQKATNSRKPFCKSPGAYPMYSQWHSQELVPTAHPPL